MKVKTGYHIGTMKDLEKWNPLNPHGLMVPDDESAPIDWPEVERIRKAEDAKRKKDA